MNDVAARQLATIARVVDSFERARIDYALFGGWAVDFHAGRVTRHHDDIDVTIWRDDLPKIAALLESDGWRHAPEPDEDGGTGYERDGIRLELTYLVRTADGTAAIQLRQGPVQWPSDALPPVAAELAGVHASVMPREPLARGKARTRDDADDAAKDRADSAALAALDES